MARALQPGAPALIAGIQTAGTAGGDGTVTSSVRRAGLRCARLCGKRRETLDSLCKWTESWGQVNLILEFAGVHGVEIGFDAIDTALEQVFGVAFRKVPE